MKIPFGYCGKIRNSNMIFSSYPLKNIIFPRFVHFAGQVKQPAKIGDRDSNAEGGADLTVSLGGYEGYIQRSAVLLNFNSRISLSWNLEVICQTVSSIFQALRYVSSLYAQSYSPPSASTYSRRIRGNSCSVR